MKAQQKTTMCLHTNDSFAVQGGAHPFNKPYNDSNIRFKVLRRGTIYNPRDFSSCSMHHAWKRNVWHKSSRISGRALKRRTDYVHKGFHFFVDAPKGVFDPVTKAIVAFEVRGFIAAGTNNGDTKGEVWHEAKPIGFVHQDSTRSKGYRIVRFK